MILADVVAELAVGLARIEGLEIYEYLPKQIAGAPAAILAYPDDGAFDLTYARGSDGFDPFPIVVAVGDVYGPQTMADVSGYVSGSGARSVKAAVEAIENPTAFDFAVVTAFEVTPLTFNRVEYLSVIFDCTIVGSGQ